MSSPVCVALPASSSSSSLTGSLWPFLRDLSFVDLLLGCGIGSVCIGGGGSCSSFNTSSITSAFSGGPGSSALCMVTTNVSSTSGTPGHAFGASDTPPFMACGLLPSPISALYSTI
eukprot:Mycagemm_TRINITY_DN10486_c0_g1::TRINITY_DN10486_c0_g1_i1::g.1494::m.1494 type:complete len:116 gc:universal TRINITY_DN10486_c0_g1_i1:376-29(-)